MKNIIEFLKEWTPLLAILAGAATLFFILHICMYEERIVRITDANVVGIEVHRNFFGTTHTEIDIEEPLINNVCVTSDTIPKQISGYKPASDCPNKLVLTNIGTIYL